MLVSFVLRPAFSLPDLVGLDGDIFMLWLRWFHKASPLRLRRLNEFPQEIKWTILLSRLYSVTGLPSTLSQAAHFWHLGRAVG
jgi:hypothetical protein